MATGDAQARSTKHSHGQGKFVLFIGAGIFCVLIVGISLLCLFAQFKGSDSATATDRADQVQIARHLANSNGPTTRYIRPIALGMLQARQEENTQLDSKALPDFLRRASNQSEGSSQSFAVPRPD